MAAMRSIHFKRRKNMDLRVLKALAEPDAPLDRRYEALPRRRCVVLSRLFAAKPFAFPS